MRKSCTTVIKFTAGRWKQQIQENNSGSYLWVKWSACGFSSSTACPVIPHLSAPKASFTFHRIVYIGKDPWKCSPTPSSKQVPVRSGCSGTCLGNRFSIKALGKTQNISRESCKKVIKVKIWSLKRSTEFDSSS